MFAYFSIIGGNANTIMGSLLFLYWLTKSRTAAAWSLRGTKNDCLFALIGVVHKYLNTFCLPCFYLYDFVEVGFGVKPAFFNFALNDLVIAGIDVIIKCCFNAFYFEWR